MGRKWKDGRRPCQELDGRQLTAWPLVPTPCLASEVIMIVVVWPLRNEVLYLYAVADDRSASPHFEPHFPGQPVKHFRPSLPSQEPFVSRLRSWDLAERLSLW